MKNLWVGGLATIVALVTLLIAAPPGPAAPTAPAAPADGTFQVVARPLIGFDEVPPVSTVGRGTFRATVTATSIEYELTYNNLEGTASAAHIHFGQRWVSGGVAAFLCGGGDKPPCPPSGTVTGTIDAADVIGPATQGIAAGEFVELRRAIRAGVTYVNVHSDLFPGGEIRWQIERY
ncbi:MAG TPA: CHRD domain-containing protein [bacterium]|nr:CHRD domain-containing protein [bacterium]